MSLYLAESFVCSGSCGMCVGSVRVYSCSGGTVSLSTFLKDNGFCSGVIIEGDVSWGLYVWWEVEGVW